MTEITTSSLTPMKEGDRTGEGAWGAIKERREKCGADLLTLMIDTGSESGTTGYGDITTGQSYSGWVSQANRYCSCCAIRAVANDYTLAHEIGHLALHHTDIHVPQTAT